MYQKFVFILQNQYFVLFSLLARHTQVSRQNFLSHGKTFFLTAKLSFSRQNFLSHGKTFFLTAKHSFSRQNTLSHGKTFFLTAKLSFSRQLFHFTIKFHDFTNGRGRVVNMAAEEDRMDDFIQKDFFNGFTYGEICMFLERNHECVVSITTLKRKVKQLGLRRRMPCYNIDAIRRKNSRNVGWPCNISRGGREFTQLDGSLCTRELIHT